MGEKLQVVALSKAYRVDGALMPVLEEVDLAAAEGSFVSIIGPSGCGKSTLFSIISGLQRPDRGQVLLDGNAGDTRLGQVGYMPQRDLLLPWRSVLGNAILGPEVHGEEIAAARREAQELLPLFGLDGFGDSLPAALSGGMRQRAALLRTFLCRRDVLLLDEPFGALDAITRMDLQEWLARVWQEFGYTILFITHDVEEAIFLADRVYVLSPRPARVRLDLPIGLPRPRSRSATLSPAFAALKERVLEALMATDSAAAKGQAGPQSRRGDVGADQYENEQTGGEGNRSR